MNEANGNQKPGILKLVLVNRHLIITSIILFVLAASAYLFFSSANYNVKVRLTVAGSYPSAEDAIKHLQAETSLQKTINSLPLQVSYYQKGIFKRTEIYGDSLPIKFVLRKGSVFSPGNEVVANTIDNNTCTIDQNNVLIDVSFNHPVGYAGLNFIILKGPAFKGASGPLTIKFNTPASLTARFSKALNITRLNNGALELSLRVDNVQKGQDFLNKLIAIVNKQYANAGAGNEPATHNAANNLSKLNDSILYLKALAKKHHDLQSAPGKPASTAPVTLSKKEKVALDVLAALKPYVMKSANLFVLIPDGYDVNDANIENMIKKFNTTELDKQRELQEPDVDDTKVTNLDVKISSLKQELLTAIDLKERQIKSMQHTTALKTPRYGASNINDSLIHINAMIAIKQQQYDGLVNSAVVLNKDQKLTIVQQSDTRESVMFKSLSIYVIALLAGLLLPMLVLAVIEFIIPLNHHSTDGREYKL